MRDERDILCGLNNPNFLYLTILYDEKIVGGILYRIKGSTPFVKNLRWGKYYLGRVYISPEYQNKGIATEAILQSEKFLKKPRKLYVDFPEDLDKNRKCYTKCGYKDTKKRLAQGERIVEVLKQDRNSPIDVELQVVIIYAVVNDFLADIKVSEIADFESGLFEFMKNHHNEILAEIKQTGDLSKELSEKLKEAIEEYKKIR